MRQNASFGDVFCTTIADVVGFLRDHAPFWLPQDHHSSIIGDLRLSWASRCYRYFAYSRHRGLFYGAQNTKQHEFSPTQEDLCAAGPTLEELGADFEEELEQELCEQLGLV